MRFEAKTPKGKVEAGTASKALIPGNASRSYAVITNGGAKDVWIAYGETAAAEEGIYLKKEGGGHVVESYSGPLSVITKEGTSIVSFIEV
jgi:hypothetical protein